MSKVLSVVIPTLDEAPRLPRLLQDLKALTISYQVVVADGGSSDGSAAVAAAHGCTVVTTAPGRGVQLRAGAAAATGEWLLVLHADARVSPAALAEAETAVAGSRVRWAAWPLAIGAPGLALRLVEWGAALRWRLAGLPYGDQGLLVERELYYAAGGYPPTRIMEDVVLVRALRRLAPMTRFRHPIVADARRWQREGGLRRSLRNAALLMLFLAGVDPDRLARWYLPESR